MSEASHMANDLPTRTASGISEAVSHSRQMQLVDQRVIKCRACPRLVEWRERVGREKRRAFIDQEYWARPVPGFGDPDGRIFVLGLAPAAHGANRTGRVFTGDRSGDWLFAALHRAGLANQPVSQSADDGLELFDTYVSAAVKCAPPDNRPTIDERDNCFGYLPEEFQALGNSRVILCLGGFAWKQGLKLLEATGEELPRPKPRFGHGHRLQIGQYSMVGCYHPSQQNTFTGRLTEEMLDDVLQVAKAAASI